MLVAGFLTYQKKEKDQQPDFYARFKEMREALKS